jgi:hypothetical protein
MYYGSNLFLVLYCSSSMIAIEKLLSFSNAYS